MNIYTRYTNNQYLNYSFLNILPDFFRRMLKVSNVTGVSVASLTFTRTTLWAVCHVSVSECPLSVNPPIWVSSRFVYIIHGNHGPVWTLTQKFTVSEIQYVKVFSAWNVHVKAWNTLIYFLKQIWINKKVPKTQKAYFTVAFTKVHVHIFLKSLTSFYGL